MRLHQGKPWHGHFVGVPDRVGAMRYSRLGNRDSGGYAGGEPESLLGQALSGR